MKFQEIKKIDIHAHAVLRNDIIPPNTHSGYTMVNTKELLGFYDKLNIEKGVLLPCVMTAGLTTQYSNSDAKIISDENPDRFLWFCNVDPRAMDNSPRSDLSKLLNFYKGIGAKGLGELSSQLLIDDPLMDNLFYHCAECDMPVTIHLAPANAKYGYYGIKDDVGLPRLEKMLKKHPNLKIFGHSQLFWAEISADVTEENRVGYPSGKVTEGRLAQLLRECPNLYCDTSAGSGANAFMRDPEYAARFIEEFSDRIMYGCDICAICNTHPFQFDAFLTKMVEEKMFSEENYYKLVRGNAERLLNL